MGSKARKLILHLDVNNTIFVGDSKTKLTALEGVLNEYLTEILWGNVDEDDVWTSLKDNSISTSPPSKTAISYYKYAEHKYEEAGKPRSEFKDYIRRFTLEGNGQQFRPYLESVKEKLKVPETLKVDAKLNALVMTEGDSSYYRILPSYFKLLTYLVNSERNFAIILRTFGNDGDLALKATQLYTENQHPDFPFPPGKTLAVDPNPGRIVPSQDGLSIITPNGSTVSCCNKIYDTFSTASGVQLYLDSYDWWKKNDFTSEAGKPLLIDPSDKSVQHILLDDNIRSWDPSDNIVSLLVKENEKFVQKDCKKFDGLCVLRTHLFESILNEDYFIEVVEMCEKNFNEFQSEMQCVVV